MTVRNFHRVDRDALEQALRTSVLLTDPADTVDGFTTQLTDVVSAELLRLAPPRDVRQVAVERCRRRQTPPSSSGASLEGDRL